MHCLHPLSGELFPIRTNSQLITRTAHLALTSDTQKEGATIFKGMSTDVRLIESQAPESPKRKSVLFRVCCPLFIILPSMLDILWQCLAQYIQLYPLSVFARTIRRTSESLWVFTVSENFFMILVVGYNTFLVCFLSEWKLPISLVRLAQKESPMSILKTLVKCCKWVIVLAMLVAFIALPFWWRNFAWSFWRRSLWNNTRCQGWDYLITMDTISFREFSAFQQFTLSKASIRAATGSNYTMHLEHPTSTLSRILLQTDDGDSTPYLVDYDFVQSSYSSPNLSGTFTNFPLLSFPDLSMSSLFPNYTWSWGCDPPGVVLTDGHEELVRTTIGSYDDCTMLRVCGMGSIDRLVVPLGAILIEMEKSGLCCTSPFVYVSPQTKLRARKRPNTSEPLSRQCLSVSQSLSAVEGALQPNQDISGIGVRLTIYVQALMNNFVAFTMRTADEAISVNTLNLIVIATIALSSGFTTHPDWPHLIILYHYLLLIQHSGVTYNTPTRAFRKSPTFGPLMEHLTILDLIAMPFFIMLSGSLWLGIFLTRGRSAQSDCDFGSWIFFGYTVNLKEGRLVIVGCILAAILVAFYILWCLFDMICRTMVVGKISDIISSGGKSSPARLAPEVKVTGDYLSAWFWRQTETMGGILCGYRVEIRCVVMVWRTFLWLYLVVTTEQIIAVNGFGEENSLTYGQTYTVLLLIVPFGILWNRCYLLFPKFAMFFDSIDGQKVLWAFIALTLCTTYSAAVYAHYEDANVQRAVWALAILGCFLPAYVRKRCSEKVDSLLGNRTTISSTASWWDMWSIPLHLRIPQALPPKSKTCIAADEVRTKPEDLAKFRETELEKKKDA